MRYISFLIAFFIATNFSFSQTKKLDSLWAIYNNKTQADTNRLKAIHSIAAKYKSNNPDTALVLADLELKLAQTTKQKKYEGDALNLIGTSYFNKGNYPKTLECYLKTLKIYEEIGYKLGIGDCYNNIGLVYNIQTDYPKALEYLLKDLAIEEKTTDKKMKGICYSNIGSVYINLSDYPKALGYYEKALQLRKEIGDKRGVGICYGSIGVIHFSQSNYPKALEYYLKALKIFKETMDKQGMGSSFVNLGGVYNKLLNFKLAVRFSDSALQISKEIGDIERQCESYENLAIAYGNESKYKEAYENHIKFKQLTDSIFNSENSKQLGDMKTNFEVEKKEAELKIKAEAQEAISKEEKKRQQFIIYSVVGLLVLVIVFAAFMFNRFKVTQKQKNIIEIKERETQEQKHIIEEKHKEITDSINYAERIQRSFLATKSLLNENLSEYFVFFQPKDVVSGDFYWATKLKNNNFIMVTADSTGHGVPGAIMSILNISCLENAIKEGVTESSEILNHTRINIIERLKKDGSIEGGKDGMDASLISFDFYNMRFSYSAGNNPIWVNRENKLIELSPDKMPVGKHDKDQIPFTQHQFNVQKGDVVYALTDGFPDQFGGLHGKKFKYKQLKELLIGISHEPMEIQKQKLNETFNKWKGDLEQVDDVTIIGIRI